MRRLVALLCVLSLSGGIAAAVVERARAGRTVRRRRRR